jgi:hypothetical protein
MSFAFFRQAGRRHSKEAWSMARTLIALQSLSLVAFDVYPAPASPNSGRPTGRQTRPSCLEALIFSTGFPNKGCIFLDNSI